MKYPDSTAFIEIDSFVGMCAGAEHVYGTVSFKGEKEGFELTRKIGLIEAQYLDTKTRSFGQYQRVHRKGGEINQFNTEEELIKNALARPELEEIDFVFVGSPVYAEPQKCVKAPANLEELNTLFEEFDALYCPRGSNDGARDLIESKFVELLKS